MAQWSLAWSHAHTAWTSAAQTSRHQAMPRDFGNSPHAILSEAAAGRQRVVELPATISPTEVQNYFVSIVFFQIFVRHLKFVNAFALLLLTIRSRSMIGLKVSWLWAARPYYLGSGCPSKDVSYTQLRLGER